MPRIEELSDGLNESLSLNKNPAAHAPETPEAMLSQNVPFPFKPRAQESEDPGHPSAPLPPGMASVKQHSTDELLNILNKTPLFMTSLDETNEEGDENVQLEALKALAYEGTRGEVAGNFREQGNEFARAKRWSDAKEFYDKALAALKGPLNPPNEEGPADKEIVEVNEEEERKKELAIEEACYVNRALCNLEKSRRKYNER